MVQQYTKLHKIIILEGSQNIIRRKKFIGDELQPAIIKSWSEGEIILVKAQTGSGKTFFVFNNLISHCKAFDKKILLLSNRNTLKKQNAKAVKESNDNDIIRIMNYQWLETAMNNLDIPHFDYIVVDECHYFFSDAVFNRKTDLAFKWILEQDKSIRILLSATGGLTEKYLTEHNTPLRIYDMDTDYGYINKLYFYNTDKIFKVLFRKVSSDEKLLYFASANKALKTSQEYGGTFICSPDNQRFKKHINSMELKNIVDNERFDNHILCATSVLDNGVNIKDPQIKHIIVDYPDLDTVQQCIGRLRPEEKQSINIYIKNFNKNILGLQKRNLMKKIKPADILKLKGEQQYIKNYGKALVDIVDIVSENGQTKLKVNEIMYFKIKESINQYELMEKNAFGFMMAANKRFNRDINNISILDYKFDSITLDEFLNKVVGIKMFKAEQGKFKEFLLTKLFNAPKMNHGRLGFNAINGFLADKNLNFKLENGREKSGVNRNKSYWIVLSK